MLQHTFLFVLLFLADNRFLQSFNIGHKQQLQPSPPAPFSQSSTSTPRSQQPRKAPQNHTTNHQVSGQGQNAEANQSNSGHQVSALGQNAEPSPKHKIPQVSVRPVQLQKALSNKTTQQQVSAQGQNAKTSPSTSTLQLSAKWHFSKSQEARQEILNTRCSKPLPPISIQSWLSTGTMVDEERKLIYCQVPKAASSIMKRALVESSGRMTSAEMNRRTQKMISE